MAFLRVATRPLLLWLCGEPAALPGQPDRWGLGTRDRLSRTESPWMRHHSLALGANQLFSTDLAGISWLDHAASVSSIVSAAIAVLAVLLGIWVSGTLYQTLALVNRRRRHIGRAARSLGLCSSRVRFMRTCVRMLSSRIHRGPGRVQDELTWLSGLSPTWQTEEGLSPSYPVPIPFTFAIAPERYASALTGLAAAYDAYASSLRRRWLLRSAAGPLAAEEHECARATARLLSRWASFEPVRSPTDPDNMRGRLIELAGGLRSTRLVTWPDMNAARATPGFPVVGASYQPYRVVMEGSPARSVRAEPEDVRLVPNVLGTATSNPLTFDGVLPRWHGPGYRLELDRLTGRQKLHLCVAETTYFALRATQEPDAAALAGEAARCSRLLGLNLLALDQDDIILLTRRSNYVVYPGCYSGTVTGNAEFAPREGLEGDLDNDGLPDLLAAIAREAREELGLDLTTEDSQLAALGVIEYASETELESHALVATARLPTPAADIRVARSAPDPVEGLWELGDQFMTIDLGTILKNAAIGRDFVMWLRSSEDLAPQGAGSLLLLLTARLELRQRQAARVHAQRTSTHPEPWTTCELATWLEEPLPSRLPSLHGVIGHHSLWR